MNREDHCPSRFVADSAGNLGNPGGQVLPAVAEKLT